MSYTIFRCKVSDSGARQGRTSVLLEKKKNKFGEGFPISKFVQSRKGLFFVGIPLSYGTFSCLAKVMKTMNNFQISGFVVNNATINQFATASIARFGLSVRRTEKNGDAEKKVSAILNIEAWKSNEASDSFNLLTKGTRVTVEGYFKPEEWTDKDNVNHNTIKLVATKFFEMKDEDKSDETPAEQPKEEKKKKAKK